MAKVMLARPLRNPTTSVSFVKKKEGTGNNHPLSSPPYREEGGRGVFPRARSGEDQVDEVMGLLDQLSPEARKTILAKLSLANITKSPQIGQERDLDMWAHAVYESLGDALGGAGAGLVGPAMIKRILAAPGSWKAVTEFMRVSRMDQVKVTERQAIYRMLADLVVGNARYISGRSGVPLSPKLVSTCSVNIAGIFDQAFPGYLASGLAFIVAKRLLAPVITEH
jgi:hypothetical protein